MSVGAVVADNLGAYTLHPLPHTLNPERTEIISNDGAHTHNSRASFPSRELTAYTLHHTP